MNFKKLCIATLFLPYSLFAKEIEIKIMNSNNVKPKIYAVLYLRKEKGKFYCRTEGIPDHMIKIPWLKSLSSPKDLLEKNVLPCERKIQWGNKIFCENEFNQFRFKQLARWCSQI